MCSKQYQFDELTICINEVLFDNHLGQLIFKSYQLSKISMDKEPLQKMCFHPLFMDSQFVPNDLRHVLFKQPNNKQHQSSIVVPYQNQEISMLQLESQLKSKIGKPTSINQSSILVSQQLSNKNGSSKVNSLHKETLEGFKRLFGKKKDSIQEFQILMDNQLTTSHRPLLTKNNEKYEFCIIMMENNFDPFSVLLQWSQEIDIQKQVVGKINEVYSSDLTKKDLQLSQLNVQLSINKQYCSFLFKRTQIVNPQQLQEIVFGDNQPVYIGVSIINSKFKYRRPNRFIPGSKEEDPKQQHLRKVKSIQKLKAQILLQKSLRFIVVQFQDNVAMRLNYNQVKGYKVKFLFGILKVPFYDRKGLMVLGKIYKPDDYVSQIIEAFLISKEFTFIHAKIVSEKQLFMSQINKEHPMDHKQMRQMFKVADQKQPNVGLKVLVSQTTHITNQTQQQRLVSEVVKDFINGYFTRHQLKDALLWRKYIKLAIRELQSLKKYQGWVFRVVNYQYNKKEHQIVQFSNFIVASTSMTALQCKKGLQTGIDTLFKIKSQSGRKVEKVTQFELEEVVFLPYTSFQIISKTQSPQLIEYQLKELIEMKLISRANLLVSVDDKPKEGRIIFEQLKKVNLFYPIYFFQVSSNNELKRLIGQKSQIFTNPAFKKIIMSNMKRTEDGKVVENAGVHTYTLSRQLLGHQNVEIVYYIGWMQGAKQKLKQQQIDASQYQITNNSEDLRTKLVQLCNWEGSKKIEQPQNSFMFSNSPQWSNVFSGLNK